jgi:hypothetical protein
MEDTVSKTDFKSVDEYIATFRAKELAEGATA